MIFRDILDRLDRLQRDVEEVKKTVALLHENQGGNDITLGLASILGYDGRGDRNES